MPLTLNVGLSRKTSENYNSKGVSINLTAELDQALLNRPDELQDRVAALYREAEVALRVDNSGFHTALHRIGSVVVCSSPTASFPPVILPATVCLLGTPTSLVTIAF